MTGGFRLAHERLAGWEHPSIEQAYTERDCMLYALGCGLGHDDPTRPDVLAYTYERDLQVLPTMACVLAQARDWLREPWTGIDYESIVHGEEDLVVHAPLPAGGTVVGHTRIADLVDKGPGRGALIAMQKRLVERHTGRLLATSTTTIFARANGGFGGSPGAASPAWAPLGPHEAITIPTSRRMALLYRLSGDRNPLHVNPATARRAGYERPIGHGLSIFAAAAHALLRHAGAPAAALRRLSARFSAPFLPGETLRLLVEGRRPALRFELHSADRGVALLTRGRAAFD